MRNSPLVRYSNGPLVVFSSLTICWLRCPFFTMFRSVQFHCSVLHPFEFRCLLFTSLVYVLVLRFYVAGSAALPTLVLELATRTFYFFTAAAYVIPSFEAIFRIVVAVRYLIHPLFQRMYQNTQTVSFGTMSFDSKHVWFIFLWARCVNKNNKNSYMTYRFRQTDPQQMIVIEIMRVSNIIPITITTETSTTTQTSNNVQCIISTFID